MEDDTTSLCAALFGLAGFEVLAAADAAGELELLIQTTADLVGCPGCGAVARAKGFLQVAASPLTRSSYHAGDDFRAMRATRDAQLARAVAKVEAL